MDSAVAVAPFAAEGVRVACSTLSSTLSGLLRNSSRVSFRELYHVALRHPETMRMMRPGKAFQHPVPGTARASGVSLCRLRLRAAAVAAAVALVVGTLAGAAQAPGAPGASSSWTSGAKQGLGTSTTLASKVWYTLGQGTLNEVYYPTADIPDVHDLEFIVTDESSFVALEPDVSNHFVKLMAPAAF